ncbi:hypothetical protein FDI24_gp242 [Acidovorax phage ACP17]|uniref:DUF7768 domain-containing protein n=1 Tax=Acidovorax phage ACP17 TaxID=2010329 RepID=A0A218M399_9CAUD|nr:hypothetical protein FDI24_gp242 [Acidovorax phage ACP17]ASD50523.1 hypothetical protein [Acidovorax phage ACP17]
MALKGSQLAKILAPKFMTGGTPDADVPADPKRPGVPQYTSAFERADQREALNVAKYTRKRAVLISPFMPEDLSNAGKMLRYANRAVQDSLMRNEAPIASHAFFFGLAPNVPIERDAGLHSQLSWIPKADVVVVYVDFGITAAMQVAINVAEVKAKKIEYRSIGATA